MKFDIKIFKSNKIYSKYHSVYGNILNIARIFDPLFITEAALIIKNNDYRF